MSEKKKIWDSRADIRGGIEGGLRDHAHVITMSHTQWDVTALQFGVDDRLTIELDGVDLAVVNLQAPGNTRTILDLNTLVADINNGFANGNPAYAFRGGRLLIRSYREGVGSYVNISGDVAALQLLDFNKLETEYGRSFEDAAYNEGGENNPPGTLLVAEGEQDIREVNNRPASWLATIADKMQGYLNAEYAVPDTLYPINNTKVKTMDDLGAPRILMFTSFVTWPVVDEIVIGGSSGARGYIYNVGPEPTGSSPAVYYIAIVDWFGDFVLGESVTGTSSGLIGSVDNIVKDHRIRAVRIDADVYVGSLRTWDSSIPTTEQLESLFNVTVRPTSIWQEPGTHRNAATLSGFNTSGEPRYSTERPYRTGRRVRVSRICAGEPDSPYTPSFYSHTGIIRTPAVDILSWTKNRIYPAIFHANVQVGDVLTITNSQSTIGGVDLNNGNYCIIGINTTEQYYEIGPSKPGLNALPNMPEDILADAEIYDVNSPTVPQAQCQVTSPSYGLNVNQLDLNSVDRSCWIFLEEPIEAYPGEVWVNYYRVTTEPLEEVGVPELESPTAKYQKARIDDLERMLRGLDIGGIAQGKLQMGRWPSVDTYKDNMRMLAHYTTHDSPDQTSRLDVVAPARVLAYNHRTSSMLPTIDPKTSALIVGSTMSEDIIPNAVYAVKNMMNRKVAAQLVVIHYTADNGTPPSIGVVLTGADSGAQLVVRSANPLTKTVYAEFLAGSVMLRMPEQLEWSGGLDFLTGVTVDGYWGFSFVLPPSQGEIITATIPAVFSDQVFLSTDPIELDIRPGDLFQATSGLLSVYNFKSRIKNVVSNTQLELETGSPLSAVDFEFKITPDISDTTIMAGFSARVRKGSAVIQLEGLINGLPCPYYHGVTIGDLLEITGVGLTQPVPIKRVIVPEDYPAVPYPSVQLLEIDTDVDKLVDGTGAWRIISRHHRGNTKPNNLLSMLMMPDTFEGANLQQVVSGELWYLKGPAFIEILLVGYHDIVNRGGVTGGLIPTWPSSGLLGKDITFDLYSGGEHLDSVTVTFTTNPPLPTDLVNDLQTLLGASAPWLSVQLSKVKPALVFTTVPLLFSTGYTSIGPAISLEISGSAWETLVAANESITRGNLSRVVKPFAYQEQLRLVVESPTDLISGTNHVPLSSFEWSGVVDMVVPVAELGNDKASYGWVHNTDAGVNKLRAADVNTPVSNATRFYTQDGQAATPFQRPTLHLSSDREWPYDAALLSAYQVSLGSEVTGYATHGGQLGSKEYVPVLSVNEHANRVDALGKKGRRLEWVYSGPIGVKRFADGSGTWDGQVLSLIVEHGRQYFIVTIQFTAAHNTLDAIAAHIHSELHIQVDVWLGCCVDQQGTGFVIYVDEAAFGASDPPFLNNNFRILYNHRKSTLHQPLVNEQYAIKTLGVIWPGRYDLAPHLHFGSSVGAVDGFITDRGGGRRLIVPAHADKFGTKTTPLKEEVWWEERIESIKQDMEFNEVGPASPSIGLYPEGVQQDETLTIAGGHKPGPGKLFLYQFPGAGENTFFAVGDTVYFVDADGNTQETRIATQRTHTRPDKAGDAQNGLVVSLARVSAGRELPQGGTFLGDDANIALATKLAFYNPVLLLLTNYLGTLPSKGQDIRCTDTVLQATGLCGGTFTVGIDEYLIVYKSSTSWRNTRSTYRRADSWYSPSFNITSNDEPTFSATVTQVDFLDSNILDGGLLRSVLSLSYKGFNEYEAHLQKPSVLSHGDMQVLEGGNYLYHERLPTNASWPKRSGPDESGLDQVSLHPVGRPYCVEVPAEEGHAVLAYGLLDNAKAVYDFPFDPYGMSAPTTINTLGPLYEARLYNDQVLTEPSTFWSFVPPVTGSSLWVAGQTLYSCVSFHIPVPDRFTAIEGYGAYIYHQKNDHLGNLRGPALVVLEVATGQDKKGTYIHRLEVEDTRLNHTAEQFIRVDSGGGGGRIPLYSYTPPPWARPTQWSPMPTVALHGDRGMFYPLPAMEHTLEVFVEDLTIGTAPIIGDTLYALLNPGPEGRRVPIAYVEQFGPVFGSTTAYRFLVHLGPTSVGTPPIGYPRTANLPFGVEETNPRDMVYSPWDIFHPGEQIFWTGPFDMIEKGHGRIVKVNRYPHGNNVRIKVYIPAWRSPGGGAQLTVDRLAGVYVRFRCDRLNLNKL